MIHDDQFRFIEVEHFTQLLRDLKNVITVPRFEQVLVPDPDQFIRIGFDEAIVGQPETKRGRSEDVSYEPEAFAIPSIKVGARTGRQDHFHRGQSGAGIHFYFH